MGVITIEAILAMFGYEKREAIGKAALEFIASEHRDRTQWDLLSGYQEPYEIIGVKENGKRLCSEIRGETFRYRGRGARANAVCDVTEHKEAGKQIHRPNEELGRRGAERTAGLAESESHLKDLAGRLVATQEEERRRLACEVHDSLTQVAIAAYHHLEHFASEHPTGSTVTEGEIAGSLALVRQTVGEARLVNKGLRPAALDDSGLTKAVEVSVADLEARGWEVDSEDTLGEEPSSREVEPAFYRVFQQPLTNVRKYACSNKAHAKHSFWGANIRIEVRDEECGFTASLAAAVDGVGESLGLAGMPERIALLGCAFEVTSNVGSGTSVEVEVPLAGSGERVRDIRVG